MMRRVVSAARFAPRMVSGRVMSTAAMPMARSSGLAFAVVASAGVACVYAAGGAAGAAPVDYEAVRKVREATATACRMPRTPPCTL